MWNFQCADTREWAGYGINPESHIVQVVRQIIDTTRRGDSIDLGLSITSSGSSVSPSTETPSGVSSPVPADDDDESLQCIFEIHHRLQSLEMPAEGTTPTNLNPPRTSERPDPNFGSVLLQRLLLRCDASLASEAPDDIISGRTFEVKLRLQRGSPEAINAKSSTISEQSSTLLSGVRLGTEPSLEELTQFAETLRGKKVTLYASTASSFAHHLTSYLTAWGLDVSHLSSEADADSTPNANEAPAPPGRERGQPLAQDPRCSAMNGSNRPAQSLSFVMIDDDVSVLRDRLRKYRAEQPVPLNLHSRKRPSLAAHHRPKSSPQVARSLGFGSQASSPYAPVVLVHFTSLSNYKLVKEIIHCELASHSYATYPPEVMIIPKPAGPRRFLTALHTAVTKPIVDPFFTPIATSPLSPGLHNSPFFNLPQTSPKSPSSRPSTSARSNSDRSTRSARDGTGEHHPHAPPSPLSLADNMEYFPETQSPVRLGQTPSSGLVISSPDGQPAGIIFQPRAKSAKPIAPSPSGILVDRDKPQFLVPNTDRLRGSTPRRPSDGEQKKQSQSPLSFAALHSNVLGSALEASPIEGVMPLSGAPKAKAKRAISPQVDEPSPSSPLSPPSRNTSTVDLRKVSSPPGSPTAGDPPPSAIARRAGRRTTHDGKPSTPPTALGKLGKGQPDSSIIPPISVLIVDGTDFKFTPHCPPNRVY
jgi:osomolarity two-component system response regulator SSK1